MSLQNRKCAECSEGFASGEKHISTGYRSNYNARYYHMQCANFDIPMTSQSRAEFNSWHIKRLLEENRILRRRTNALLNQLTELLQEHGASEERIEDLKYGYNFRGGDPQEEKQD